MNYSGSCSGTVHREKMAVFTYKMFPFGVGQRTRLPFTLTMEASEIHSRIAGGCVLAPTTHPPLNLYPKKACAHAVEGEKVHQTQLKRFKDAQKVTELCQARERARITKRGERESVKHKS